MRMSDDRRQRFGLRFRQKRTLCMLIRSTASLRDGCWLVPRQYCDQKPRSMRPLLLA